MYLQNIIILLTEVKKKYENYKPKSCKDKKGKIMLSSNVQCAIVKNQHLLKSKNQKGRKV